MAAAIGIARRPALPAAEAHGDRRIVHVAGKRILAGLRQREQVDKRLQQRSDRALRLDCAVEAVLAWIAAADHGHDFTVVHVGHHDARLQRRLATRPERFHRPRDRALGGALRGGRHAGHDRQARTRQRFFRIVAGQLAAHEVDVGGEAVGRHRAGRFGHAQRRLDGAVVLGLIDDAGFEHLAQHERAPLTHAFGMLARVVVGRALDDADQQRDLLGVEIGQVATEPEFRRRRDAVDRLRATLAEVHLVEISLEDFALLVARVDDQRVQDLVALASQGLLAADAEQSTARELLGQRAGALPGFARARVDERRAQHAAEVDADVAVEVAVLDRLETGDQQLRHFVDADQPTLFVLLSIQRRDARGIQAHATHGVPRAHVAHGGHPSAGQRHLDAARADRAADVLESAAADRPASATARICAYAATIALAIGRGVEFRLERRCVDRGARHEFERTCIHAGRQLPAQLSEALADFVVQIQHVGDQEPQPQTHDRQQPGQKAAWPHGSRGLVERVVFVVIGGIDSGHGMTQ